MGLHLQPRRKRSAANATTIPSFDQGFINNGINLDFIAGSLPIQASDGFLYGTIASTLTSIGPISIVWKMSLSGTFAIISTFPADTDQPYPYSILLQGKDGNLYGTATEFLFDGGTVFKVTTAGDFTVLHTFNGSDGSLPNALVWATDGSLYGTTNAGGTFNSGTFFKVSPAGAFRFCTTFRQFQQAHYLEPLSFRPQMGISTVCKPLGAPTVTAPCTD